MGRLKIHSPIYCLSANCKNWFLSILDKHATEYSRLRLLYRDWSPPSHRITELFETPGASHFLVVQLKMYRHSKSSEASSLCWLGRTRGTHGNHRCHSAVKWDARWKPASQIPQISEHPPVTSVWRDSLTIHTAGPRKCYNIHGQIFWIAELYVVTIYLVN